MSSEEAGNGLCHFWVRPRQYVNATGTKVIRFIPPALGVTDRSALSPGFSGQRFDLSPESIVAEGFVPAVVIA